MLPSYPLILSTASADGVALTNSVAAASIMPASAIATIPAGSLQVGSTLKLMLRGRMSTVVTTPGTLTLDVRLGSVIISAFGAMLLNVNAQTNATWEVILLATIRAVGSGTTANAIVTGCFVSRTLIGSPAVAAGGAGTAMLPDTAPVVGAGFDSTAALAINVFATWSVASASNIIQVHQAVIELKV